MRWLASVRWRLFLVCWIVFAVHFATNVVREHYPAFSIVEDGDLYLDEYQGFHADIFVHTNGHAVVGNQILGSIPAVPVLLLFDPALDALQEWTLAQRETGEGPVTEYRTGLPNRQDFFAKVNERGLSLRFGAATFLTSAFCMAPLTAWLVVLMFGVLRRRGFPEDRATLLALLFAFGTPVFYRAAHLVHNQFLMMVVFGAFLLLWRRSEDDDPLPVRRAAGAGFLAGTCLALDYAGVIPLLALYAYLLFPRWSKVGFVLAFRESLAFVAASVPPVLFLWWTQWVMYGNPFLPGQMHQQENAYTGEGVRGMTLPDPEVFFRNLFDGSFGLFPFAPLLLLAFVPIRFSSRSAGRSEDSWLVGRRERRFLWAFVWVFMAFCAMNRYSLLQFNTGFRYFLPLVPFLFLFVCDLVREWPLRRIVWIGVPAVLHTWVLSMSRYTQPAMEYAGPPVVLENWREILTQGPQLPWMKILREVVPPDHWLQSPIWPTFVLVVAFGTAAALWLTGARMARREGA